MHDPCADEVPAPVQSSASISLAVSRASDDSKKVRQGEGKTEAGVPYLSTPPPHHDRIESEKRRAQERQSDPRVIIRR